MSDNLLKIENPEQEGYTVREENGIKYIEKKEVINHEKHGECIAFFQQQVQIDENNNTIIKQRNDYYENNLEAKKIESNVVKFENEEFKDKVTENYTNGQLDKQVTNDKKTEKTIKYYEDEKEKLVKEINVLDLSNNYYIYRSEIDKKGKVTYELNREKIIEHKGKEYPFEYIFSIISGEIYNKCIILENDISKINNIYDKSGNLLKKTTTDKKTGIITREFTNIFGEKVIIEKNKKMGVTIKKTYDKSGNINNILEEDNLKGITKNTVYQFGEMQSILRKTKKLAILYQFGEIKNILKETKKLYILIEEYFEKSKLFPILKIEGVELPLMSLDKYKEVCKKYDIDPLPEALGEGDEPPAQPNSNVKKLVNSFKR